MLVALRAWPRLSHALLEKLGGGYELSMEALSRNWDAGRDWGSTRVQIDIPLSEAIVCISTVFMNVCSTSVPVMLPFQRLELTNVSTWYSLNTTQLQIQSKVKSQMSNVSKLLLWFCFETLFGCARLHFCNSIMLLENIPCKHGMEWFSSVLWQLLSDSCLAGCPKLTFKYSGNAVSLVDVTN